MLFTVFIKELMAGAAGGYLTPFFSTRGLHVHHSSFGMESITDGTWNPQPHQLVLSLTFIMVSCARGMVNNDMLTAN